jgi:hypothetical protein
MQKPINGENLGGRVKGDQITQKIKLLTPPRLIRMQNVQKREESLK